MTAALEATGLRYSYGDVTALDGVDLAVDRGEVRGVIGPNGAGKTTLFRVIAGELLPDDGRVSLDGRDVTEAPPHRRARAGLARSFQIDELFEGLSVRENLRGALAATDPARSWLRPAEDIDGVERLAARVGLEGRLDADPAALSHGDRRRLDLGLALATEPDAVLLDEPTAGLGAAETEAVERLLADLAGDVTLVIVEHDVDLVLELAERVTVLHRGTVLAEGTPAEIRADDRVDDVYMGGGT